MYLGVLLGKIIQLLERGRNHGQFGGPFRLSAVAVGLLRGTHLHAYLIELTSKIEEKFADQYSGTFIRQCRVAKISL